MYHYVNIRAVLETNTNKLQHKSRKYVKSFCESKKGIETILEAFNDIFLNVSKIALPKKII